MMDWMDTTERDLIIKFFGVDPVQEIDITSTDYRLGESDFSTIIAFYNFEYKPHEKEFWDILLPAVQTLPNKILPLEMSKVDVGYFWLDYVTKVDIRYRVVYDTLVLNVQHVDDPYHQALILICNMMFISDFREVRDQYKKTKTDKAWQELLRRAHDYQQSLLSQPVRAAP